MRGKSISFWALATAALVALSAGIFPVGGAAGQATDYIVGFLNLPSDRSHYGGDPVVGVNDDIRFFVVRTGNPDGLENRAAHDPNVEYFEKDREAFHTQLVPNDSLYANYQYDMKPSTTNMELAWDTTTGSTSVKVCVVDTGQYRGHQDFSGATWAEWKDFVNGKANPYDDNGHGTHVTGTIAARINNAKGVAGIAQASVAGAKVLSKSGFGSISNVANGITWCADIGAHIISASLGASAGSSTLLNAVNYADGKGVLQVYAAGNDGPCSNCVEYPAAYSVSVAVSCTDKNNAFCNFSSQGPEVDFAAPGASIASTWAPVNPCRRNDNNCYVLSSGTSMSTPHVAGLAALVKSAHSTFTKDDIYNAIKTTAQDLGPAGFDNQFGWGLIQGSAV